MPINDYICRYTFLIEMRTVNIFVAAVMVIGLSACRPVQKSFDLTVVQYNVGVFDKYDGSGFEPVARAVSELGADVVTLNEVDSCAVRTGKVDQLSLFADVAGGWNYHFVSAMPFDGGAYGVGVASRPELEIIRTDKVALPKMNGFEPRALAVVEYWDFIICSTHLGLREEARLEQVKVINQYFDNIYPDCCKPIFLCGDFNSLPDSGTLRLLQQTWQLLTPEDLSFPSHMPDRCIDYIFVRPNGKKVTVKSAAVVQSLTTVDLATASDHLPVVLSVTVGCDR